MEQKWIAVWGCGINKLKRTTAEWAYNTTVRLQIKMTVPGTALRVHFSNLFGTEEAEISRASVGIAAEGSAMDENRWAPLTFKGSDSGKISAGEMLVSDEADLAFEAGEKIVVNLYFKDFTHLITGHAGNETFGGKWVCSGDNTQTAQMPYLENMDADLYPFIHTIEALCPQNCYSIVAFGDSITDQSWPDRLKERLLKSGRTDVAVVRKAIGGSRVLREFPCDSLRQYGPKGLDRFEREVLQPGVKKVFILHGINDIIHPGVAGNPFRPWSDLPTAEELIEGLQYYIDTAHAHGIKVFLSPILPFEGCSAYSEKREAIREKVNHWIYREAPVEGVLPFETALLDPKNPLAMQPQYDSGDHLHPSGDGAQAIADSIPEEFI